MRLQSAVVKNAIKYVLDDKKISGTEMLVGGAAAGAVGIGAAKLAGSLILGRLGGKLKQGLGGLAGGRGSGPIPVYVVNRQMSMMPEEYGGGWQGDSGKSGKKGGRTKRRSGWLRRGSKFLGRHRGLSRGLGGVGAAITTVGSIIDVADIMTDESLTSSQKWGRTAQAGISTAGSVGGGVLGATIGSIILPGVGTAVGGMLGSMAGGWLGDVVGDWLTEPDTPKQPEAKMRIEISEDRTRVTEMDAQGMELDVDSGLYMGELDDELERATERRELPRQALFRQGSYPDRRPPDRVGRIPVARRSQRRRPGA
ncbi:hypothetical protein [Pseudodesulfovibrio sp. JC047]|uniref:hypothetical protein n=1 Tax=Pseudodesulfovibrio sp. JC047 TaxID=2683199 RepID=UPI001EF1EA52|nr:hypothetical protein [Pseudodesulfovibrio sp. JC047]